MRLVLTEGVTRCCCLEQGPRLSLLLSEAGAARPPKHRLGETQKTSADLRTGCGEEYCCGEQ